jgi:hypothetical protein
LKVLFFLFLVAMGAAGTTIDTSPATTSTGTFGATGFGTPLYGWNFTVPAAMTQLESVEFWLNGQTTLSYTANVCSFTGTPCAGAALWSSATLSGTGTGNLDLVTVNPALGVTPGQSLLFYLFASGGQGTGRLGVNGPGDDAAGNAFWFLNGVIPTAAWTGTFLDGSPIAAIEIFSGSGGGGCTANCGGGGNGGNDVPEPATFALIAASLAAGFFNRRK